MGGDKKMLRRLAPVLYIDKNTPPTFLAFGTRDSFLEDGKAFAVKSKSHGNRVDLYIIEGEVHGLFNWAPWLSRTLVRADEFLSSLGYIQGKPTDAIPGENVSRGKKGPARLRKEAKFNLNDKRQLS